ncbi:MAG TPA: hypothetical protein DHV85_25000 [Candidatus Accumulibacter sp.]|jgi:uncharacterized phiE125 gp8 family phage protein|nr:hypothetical protein [Accumulibacter sp.]
MLKLITAPTAEPVTLAEAKLHCRVDGTDDDTRITAFISAARHLAEQKTGRAFSPQTWELVLDAFPAEIEVTIGPLTAVSSIKYLDTAGAEQTLAGAAYVVDADHLPARIVPATGYAWPGTAALPSAVRVRFTCGHAVSDGDLIALKQWMLIAVATWVRHAEAVDSANLSALPRTYVDGLLDRYKVNWL